MNFDKMDLHQTRAKRNLWRDALSLRHQDLPQWLRKSGRRTRLTAKKFNFCWSAHCCALVFFVFLLKTKLDICNDRCSRDLSDLSVRGRTILGSARRAFINRASLTVPCPTHIYHPLSYSCNIPFKAPSKFSRACSDISSWTRVCYSHTESFLDFVWSLMPLMRCFLL